MSRVTTLSPLPKDLEDDLLFRWKARMLGECRLISGVVNGQLRFAMVYTYQGRDWFERIDIGEELEDIEADRE